VSHDVKLLDAYDVYGSVVDELIVELGLDARLDLDGQSKVMKSAVDEFGGIYDEYMVWVIHGDDLRSMTRALVRGNLILGRGVRFGGF
jgi:hypothetical protein